MKTLIKLVALFVLQVSSVCFAGDQFVHGYMRKSDGHYVMPYHRSAPDSNPYNNYNSGYAPNPYHQVEIREAPVQVYEPVHIQQINPMTGEME